MLITKESIRAGAGALFNSLVEHVRKNEFSTREYGFLVFKLLKLDFVGGNFNRVTFTCLPKEYLELKRSSREVMGERFYTHAAFSNIDKTATVWGVQKDMSADDLREFIKARVFNMYSFFHKCWWFKIEAPE